MRNLILTFVLCALITVGSSQTPEDEEVDQFVEAICRPQIAEGLANCAELFLPPRGKDIIFRCTGSLERNFRSNMLYAAGAFCNREELRDPLFRCWEGDLTQLYDNTEDENEKRDINKFQGCLQRVLDTLFETGETAPDRN